MIARHDQPQWHSRQQVGLQPGKRSGRQHDRQADDMLAYTKCDTFEAARAVLVEKISTTGRLQELFDSIEKPEPE